MRARYAAILLLVVSALIGQGACLPHTHSDPGGGVYNAEHDMTLLAASGTVAPLPAVPLLLVFVEATPVASLTAQAPFSMITRDAESRAPPTA